MSIRTGLTDRETQLAEDMAGVLDLLSRIIGALGEPAVNLHYASDKAQTLVERAERLELHLQAAFAQIGKEPTVRAEKLNAAISEFARHYHAGRALYPAAKARIGGDR